MRVARHPAAGKQSPGAAKRRNLAERIDPQFGRQPPRARADRTGRQQQCRCNRTDCRGPRAGARRQKQMHRAGSRRDENGEHHRQRGRGPQRETPLAPGRDFDRIRQATPRQTRLNTSVPLVPPKPKLFFTATSIFMSRAVFAQ